MGSLNDNSNSVGYAQFMSQDKLLALRLAGLAHSLSSATYGLSNQQIYDLYYSDLDKDSAKRSWQRDRKRLEALGLPLLYSHKVWHLSAHKNTEKSTLNNVAFEKLCLMLAAKDEAFPYQTECKYALIKLGNTQYLGRNRKRKVDSSPQEAKLSLLLSSLLKRIELKVNYRNRQGDLHSAKLHIYGSFTADSYHFFVAYDVDKQNIKTYRADRFTKAQQIAGSHYEIPEDFDIQKWRKLPFQLGANSFSASFISADKDGPDKLVEFLPYATAIKDDMLHISVSDTEAAARWAIVNNLIPTEPAPLVTYWRKILRAHLR